MSFTMFPKNAAQCCCSPLDAVLVSHHLEVGLLDGLLVHGGGHVVLKREHISIRYTNCKLSILYTVRAEKKHIKLYNIIIVCTECT